ncbi:hypothetical protein ACG5V6_13220 [Streptomyces chitinivorans]|uniref:Uncharacterized protein n=1 Tax=Streptomyces chitinivorans TaxID=1257027 RepID=A0ABW7HUA3_9ACTN|nr:hypothetical protein [Streptomyces chitinivorans]MDH2411949.1 hypothetical protein [Streptomyces chitinivorans]
MRKASTLVGALAALGALAVPWVHYGDIDFYAYSTPAALVCVCSAALLYACVFSGARAAQVIGIGAALTAIGFAAYFVLNHKNASAFFDGPAPAVAPRLGMGPFLAALSAASSLPALLHRDTEPATAR